MKKCVFVLIIGIFLNGLVWANINDDNFAGPSAERLEIAKQAFNNLKDQYPAVKAYRTGSLVQKLYGQSFGNGSSPENTVEQFINNYSNIFGIDARDLTQGSLKNDKIKSVPIMWNKETQSYKFIQFYYIQNQDGVPVYGAELRLLVRNEEGYPLVLASSTLRDIDSFTPDKSFVGQRSIIAEEAAKKAMPGLTNFTEQKSVIWAGIDSRYNKPVNAVTFIGTSDFPEKYRFVVDPITGDIIYQQDLIIFEDVSGNVNGMATPGPKAMQCADEVSTVFPYANVSIVGGNSAYADENGAFTITNSGTSPVTVIAPVSGRYFVVHHNTGTDYVDTLIVTPPGPANFLMNSDNISEAIRAQMNGYTNANEVRDWTLTYNPTYPTISTQTNFPVYVNRTDGYCPGNAWYDGSSLNFCSSGGGYGNTAFASVSQHEYGHHLIESAGSGQGQYGEGMSDCVAMLIADDPGLGYGFYIDDCNTPLRNAVNTYQYPCDGEIHDCGQLLSGCVWDTRNELLATNPGTYLEILSNLTVNSILLHTGTEITPQITIDYLTLDDDDANLDNGTPHYMEICAGFGAHNMDCPEINPLNFSYPDGIPTMLDPNQPTTFRVVVTGNGGEAPQSGSGMLYYSVDGGSYTSVSMTENSPNDYNAVLPGWDCYSTIDFYVSCDLVSSGTFYDPDPASPNNAVVATSINTIFSDNFETDQGWTVSGDALDGQWDRGDPVGGGDRGDPADDYDGSGQCYLTDNVDDNSDVDDGTTILTSPAFDLSASTHVTIHFAFWYSNNFGGDPNNDVMQMYISDNNGSSWVLLEELGPSYHANGGWYEYSYQVTDFVSLTSQVKVKFDVSDLINGSVVEAGLDDFQVTDYVCETSTAPVVTTTSLPDWTIGVAYNQTLEATGGTGLLTWSDKNGDLAGTGLNLSTDGILSGTPISAGAISFTAKVVDEIDSSGEKALTITVNPSVSVSTTTLPDWTAGYPYSQQLTATGGTGTITWLDKNNDLSGTGLSLSSNGLLSGTPLVGSISFTAQATDNVGSVDEGVLSFTINPNIQITSTTLPEWTAGIAYSEQLLVTGGTGTLTWADKNGDLSGTGLTLSSSGLLSGTPVTGLVSFTAEVTDVIGASGSKLFSFNVNQAVSITTTSLSEWTVSIPYSSQLEFSGGTGNINWVDKYGDLSGTGLSLSTDGILSGTPTSTGVISFSAEVSDAVGSSDEKAFTLTVNPAVVITSTTLPDWTAGFPYSQQLSATGGTGIKTWSDKYNDLSTTGLSLSTTGQINGTPLAGQISFTAVVVDEAGDTEEKVFSFTINNDLSFITSLLPEGTEGVAYNEQVTASGGTGGLVFSDLNNDLSAFGLNISSDGLISGVPTDTGTVEFTIYIEDEIGANNQQIFSFHIKVEYICGDANNDGEGPNVEDLTYLVDFIFKGGPPPPIMEAGNVDGIINGGILVDVGDLTYLVAYIFTGGNAPICE